MREAGAVLRKWSGRGALTATACVGTFVLAEAALLDGEEATTTWWLALLFRQRYPRVRLDESRIIVQSNAVVTAGAALSHLDLALALIRRVSPELANLVARYLVVDVRTSQSIYSIPDHLATFSIRTTVSSQDSSAPLAVSSAAIASIRKQTAHLNVTVVRPHVRNGWRDRAESGHPSFEPPGRNRLPRASP